MTITKMLRLIPVLLLMGCYPQMTHENDDAPPAVSVKHLKCPCDGQPACICDYETGNYSYSDGCNQHSCNAYGGCVVTMLYCGRDWRHKQ